jgi:hypothetical protein
MAWPTVDGFKPSEAVMDPYFEQHGRLVAFSRPLTLQSSGLDQLVIETFVGFVLQNTDFDASTPAEGFAMSAKVLGFVLQNDRFTANRSSPECDN